MSRPEKKQRSLLQKFLALHEHKKYLEFFTVLLSIPVLISWLILNFNNIQNLKEPKPTEAPRENGFFSAPIQKTKPTSLPVGELEPTTGLCKQELGPVNIESPEEGETIADNPVSIIISYDDKKYCPAVWAYRINGGKWSDYDDKSIALYNLPQGKIKFELKAKSLVVKDEETLTRNFTNKAEPITVTPTMSQDELGASTSAPAPN